LIDNPSYQDFATHDDSDYPELWDGCVGAWAPCLGPSGLRLHDLSGKASWGTLTGMDAADDWVVDSGRYALDFDGLNDNVPLPINGKNLLGLSIFFWVKPATTATFRTMISWQTPGLPGQPFVFVSQETSSVVRFYVDGNYRATSTYSAGVWQSFALTIGGDNLWRFYKNSAFIGSYQDDATRVFQDRAEVLYLGENTNVGYFLGAFDEMRVYNRPLSFAENNTLATSRGVAYTPRRRRRIYFSEPTFNAAWARGANQFIQPSLIGVA
jgi:hypothetical protein